MHMSLHEYELMHTLIGPVWCVYLRAKIASSYAAGK